MHFEVVPKDMTTSIGVHSEDQIVLLGLESDHAIQVPALEQTIE
jgi:hypothetical protein